VNRRRLIRAAYLEYKITKQVSTGCGEAFLAQGPRAPGGFIREELGFGAGEGPSLELTLNHLDTINARHRAILDMREGKLIKFNKAITKRNTARSAQKALRKIAHRAGIKVTACGMSR